jgi:hypothetical protein
LFLHFGNLFAIAGIIPPFAVTMDEYIEKTASYIDLFTIRIERIEEAFSGSAHGFRHAVASGEESQTFHPKL